MSLRTPRDLLLELNEDDLEKLGVVSLGHRKRLLKAISVFGSSGSCLTIESV